MSLQSIVGCFHLIKRHNLVHVATVMNAIISYSQMQVHSLMNQHHPYFLPSPSLHLLTKSVPWQLTLSPAGSRCPLTVRESLVHKTCRAVHLRYIISMKLTEMVAYMNDSCGHGLVKLMLVCLLHAATSVFWREAFWELDLFCGKRLWGLHSLSASSSHHIVVRCMTFHGNEPAWIMYAFAYIC